MNKLRNLKNRSQNALTISGGGSAPPSTIAQTPSPSTQPAASSSMFTKFSKRYANVKFLRQPPGRQGGPNGVHHHHQPAVSTGSYDLTTAELKREIGAPILISKTCIDMDTTDCRIAAADPASHTTLPTSPAPAPTTSRFEPCAASTVLRKSRSKSASNLHKSELRVFLQRAPSLKVGETASNDADDTPEADRTYAVRTRSMHNHSDSAHVVSHNIAVNSRANIHSTLSPAAAPNGRQHRKSTSSASSASAASAYVNSDAQLRPMRADTPPSTAYGSKDSLNGGVGDRTPIRRSASGLPSSVRSSREPSSLSADSLAGDVDAAAEAVPAVAVDADDADAVAIRRPANGYQALDARDLFRSIDELNAITRQMNDTDDETLADNGGYGSGGGREYCEHRDNLRPDQRRITLLRNKGQSVLNLNVKREKLGNAWSGLKHWIGEEGGRIREVVNKHAALQRVGANGQQPAVTPTVSSVNVAVDGTAEADGGEPASSSSGGGGLLQTLVRKGSKQSTASSSAAASDVEVNRT